MTTSVAIAPPKSHTPTVARIGWAVLIVATLYVCYFSHLGVIGFVGPDEPRYAWVAREMAETGDWITPRLYGKPWFEKPPLYYWGAALCFQLFGVSEVSARLPSAVSALLATLALAWLAWRLYGGETARWLLLLLPTTIGMIGFSHAAATDMPFSAMLTIAMVFAAILLHLVQPDASVSLSPSTALASFIPSHSIAAILFGLFLGLAVLAKGPAAIILCGGAVFFWALFTKRWRDALRLFHPAAIAAFCVTALPWYILCARRNPDFLRIFIIEHNFKRYLTPEFQHIQPWWFYVPVLLIALCPWTLGFLAWRSRPDRANSEIATGVFLVCFGIFPVLFFSLSQSKLPGYILPAIVPLACLLARLAYDLEISTRGSSLLPLLFAFTVLGLGIAAESLAARQILGEDILPAPWTLPVWLPMLLAAILALVFAVVRRPISSLCALNVGVLLAVLGLGRGLIWMDSGWSARGALRAANLTVGVNQENELYIYDLPRGIHYGLNFYLHREIPEWTRQTRPSLMFTSWQKSHELEKQGFTCELHIVYAAAVLCRPKSPELAADSPGGEAK